MTAMTDDEQRQQLTSFFKRYGSPILTGVLLALCVFFGWQWWSKKNTVSAANLTVQYQTILNQVGNGTPDEATYKKLNTDIAKMVEQSPDSAQAIQAQLLLAKLAFDKQEYATAAKVLTQASQSKLKDDGLLAIVNLHLAYTQVAQNQADAALKTLDKIKLESFVPSVQEARGDILVAKNDTASAIKAYQQAWDVLVARKQPRELLQIKLANLGVLVEDPKIESPVITPSPSPVSESSES